jgi:hypothetical protein
MRTLTPDDLEIEAFFGEGCLDEKPRAPIRPTSGKKRNARPEAVLQTAIAKQLRWLIAPARVCNNDGVIWFAIEQASGKKATGVDARTGKRFDHAGLRNKAKGVRSGVPDLHFTYKGRSFWIELKAGKNDTSDNQDEMHRELRRAGCSVAVCWSLEQTLAQLRGWGIPLRESAVL